MVRTIVRFDYARGADVASTLRAELVRNASGKRRPPLAKSGNRVPRPTLRVRFDDVEPFLDS
jgi:primosomal protein N' (replication factor Y) (superfamily II helicase)